MSPDELFPDQWPGSAEQESALEKHLGQYYPADDPRMAGVLGDPGQSATNIRFRIVRDMLGWVAFQYMLGELVSASFLFLAWTAIAWRQLSPWLLALYGFLAMQAIFAVPTYRHMKFADACSVLLRHFQSGVEASWVMTIGAMERTAAAMYRSIANGVVGALIGLVSFGALVKVRGWTFAGVSAVAVAALTYHRVKGLGHSVRKEIEYPATKPEGRATSIESAIRTVDATLGRWFSVDSVRPGSQTHLKKPRNHLLFLFTFDVEFGLVAGVTFGVIIHHFWNPDIRNLALAISAALSIFVMGLRKLRTKWRSIGFESLILRRFSLHSDLLTRRVVGPVFAACGRTEIVVPAALFKGDEADDGAIIAKGLRRSWIEKLIDAQIRQATPTPSSWGVLILPRGAFAQPRTLTFTDTEWEARVLELLARADAVIIEVSDLSKAVQFEVSNALRALPEGRDHLSSARWRVCQIG